MEQAVEKRAAEREHDVHVEQSLAVIFQRANQVREHDDVRNAAPANCRRFRRLAIEAGVEQHAVDDESHEQRSIICSPPADQRKNKTATIPGDAAGARQVVAQIFAALAALRGFGLGRNVDGAAFSPGLAALSFFAASSSSAVVCKLGGRRGSVRATSVAGS